MLVHNEDEFVEQALRNAAPFCDRFHVADNMSTDGTWDADPACGRGARPRRAGARAADG